MLYWTGYWLLSTKAFGLFKFLTLYYSLLHSVNISILWRSWSTFDTRCAIPNRTNLDCWCIACACSKAPKRLTTGTVLNMNADIHKQNEKTNFLFNHPQAFLMGLLESSSMISYCCELGPWTRLSWVFPGLLTQSKYNYIYIYIIYMLCLGLLHISKHCIYKCSTKLRKKKRLWYKTQDNINRMLSKERQNKQHVGWKIPQSLTQQDIILTKYLGCTNSFLIHMALNA